MTDIRVFDGRAPSIADDAYIDPAATVVGDVRLGALSSVWPQAVVRGDINSVSIGGRSNIQDGSVLHVSHAGRFNLEGSPLAIGEGVTVGHRALLHGCVIGDACLVGMGSIVMDGARLDSRSVLAAGSLVPPGKRLEGGYLWKGAPARRVRPLTDRELEYLVYAADYYVRLAARYRAQAQRP